MKPSHDSPAPSDASRRAPDPGSGKHTCHATAPDGKESRSQGGPTARIRAGNVNYL